MDDLAEIVIASEASLIVGQPPASAFTLDDVPGVGVVVTLAEGEKCQRCWKVLPEVATHEGHICQRCDGVVNP